MDSNKTVTANFTQKSYIITATARANGSITPSGSTSVNYGGSKSFVITPAKGYKITDVKVDGTSIGTPNNYSFGNVMADHTISTNFVPLWKSRRR
jgi:hypothetical protein